MNIITRRIFFRRIIPAIFLVIVFFFALEIFSTDADAKSNTQKSQVSQARFNFERSDQSTTSTTTTTTTVPKATVKKSASTQTNPIPTPTQLAVDYNSIPTYPGTPQDWMREAGIPESDWAQAELLVSREGGWRPCVAHGGKIDCNYVGKSAYGIPQAIGGGTKMASHGADWRTNPVTQLRWMKDYVASVYGSWANANRMWESRCPKCWY